MEKKISESIGTILVAVLLIAVVLSISLSLIFFSKFDFSFGIDRANWGVAGDFFGGILNPIFGFLSLVALLATIVLQNIELRETRRESKLSREAQEKSEKALADQAVTLQKQLDETRKSSSTEGFLQAVNQIQADNVRKARGIAFSLLESGVELKEWTSEQVSSAEIVCQSYDVLGMMLKNEMAPKEIILRGWNGTILKSWNATSALVLMRRGRDGADFWQHFEWLNDEAQKLNIPK